MTHDVTRSYSPAAQVDDNYVERLVKVLSLSTMG